MTLILYGCLMLALAALLAFYGTQVAREGWNSLQAKSEPKPETPAGRPYVIFETNGLQIPTELDKPVTVRFTVKNTGQSEVAGFLKDFTYLFSVNPEQKEFKFGEAGTQSFSLAPSEIWNGFFFTGFIMKPEKLAALNSGSARLFFFARGEYKNATGKAYPLTFARMYHPAMPGNLAICPDDVTFK